MRSDEEAPAMERQRYPSDLSDAQWKLLAPLLPAPRRSGRPRTIDLREILNAILYLLRTGCAWRQLPHDLPPWGTVHAYYRRFRLDGTWARGHDALRPRVREQAGRAVATAVAVIDTQSVKTTEKGGRKASMRASGSRGASAI
jgi:putative transposase